MGLLLLAVGLRLWMPGPVDITSDEPRWLTRSELFTHSLEHQNVSDPHPWGAGFTMPGVTTLWAGTAGRIGTRIGHRLGLNGPITAQPDDSAALLRWSRAMVALFVSLGLVVSTWVATRVVGRFAAFTFGVLLAVEPWFVGHGFVLHTDAMVTTFGFLSVLAMVAACKPTVDEAPGRRARWRRRGIDPVMVGVSSVAGALAVLTKLNGLAFVLPGVALVLGWYALLRVAGPGSGERWSVVRLYLGIGLSWLIGAVVVAFVMWPALWFQPAKSLRYLWDSLSGSQAPSTQFFLGHIVQHPGVAFYPVTFVFRLSPWLLIGAFAVVVTGLVTLFAKLTGRRTWLARLPEQPWIVVVAAVPYTVSIMFYGRHYDRYAMPLLPVVALCVAVLVAWCAAALGRWWATRHEFRLVPALAVLVVVALSAYVASEAPYEISYVDPMLGGQTTAQHVMLLGWGEGGSHLGRVIADREAGRCNQVRVAGLYSGLQVPCGVHSDYVGLRRGDYFAVALYNAQRGTTAAQIGKSFGLRFRKVAATTIHGVDYFVLYEVTGVDRAGAAPQRPSSAAAGQASTSG